MAVVRTIRDKCKRCYSCVRTCPARAIRIVEGQAEVIEERCIGCGNCVRVCAQKAKDIESGISGTLEFLAGEEEVYAILAPSFPAAFAENEPKQLATALRTLGFDKVIEVAVGADVTAKAYAALFKESSMPTVISTPCPAIVEYIQKFYPSLLLFLAPIVSPMIATGRIIREKYNAECKIVFIGPCIAKKKEKVDPKLAGMIDEVLTFHELKTMLHEAGIVVDELSGSDFDPPRPFVGRIFPVSGGLLRTAALEEDILDNEIIVTEGPERVTEILAKVEEGKVEARFLDLLFCRGCIDGPEMDNDLSVFIKKDIVANYVRTSVGGETPERANERLDELAKVNMQRRFTNDNQVRPQPSEKEIRTVLQNMNKFKPEDELNCGSCGYQTCREKAIAVHQGLAEVEMCLPYLVDKLQRMNEEMRETQERLIRSARLASMGEVAAGVAHEINNPLAGVLTYLKLMQKKMAVDKVPKNELNKFREYLLTMEKETIRCSDIVKNLLEFARPSEPLMKPIGVDDAVKSSLFLVKHQIQLQNINISEEYQQDLPAMMVDLKQIQQVFLNLFINSAQAMPEGGDLHIRAFKEFKKDEYVTIEVSDTGSGIAPGALHRIFDPFFTTKSEKKGTGLGLSMVSSIIEKHKGSIDVASVVGKGTAFTLKLPAAKESETVGYEDSLAASGK